MKNKYRAGFNHKGKFIYAGLFENEEDAAIEVNKKCQEIGIPWKNPALGIVRKRKKYTKKTGKSTTKKSVKKEKKSSAKKKDKKKKKSAPKTRNQKKHDKKNQVPIVIDLSKNDTCSEDEQKQKFMIRPDSNYELMQPYESKIKCKKRKEIKRNKKEKFKDRKKKLNKREKIKKMAPKKKKKKKKKKNNNKNSTNNGSLNDSFGSEANLVQSRFVYSDRDESPEIFMIREKVCNTEKEEKSTKKRKIACNQKKKKIARIKKRMISSPSSSPSPIKMEIVEGIVPNHVPEIRKKKKIKKELSYDEMANSSSYIARSPSPSLSPSTSPLSPESTFERVKKKTKIKPKKKQKKEVREIINLADESSSITENFSNVKMKIKISRDNSNEKIIDLDSECESGATTSSTPVSTFSTPSTPNFMHHFCSSSTRSTTSKGKTAIGLKENKKDKNDSNLNLKELFQYPIKFKRRINKTKKPQPIKKKRKRSKNTYYGICKLKDRKHWMPLQCLANKIIHGDVFDTAKQAAVSSDDLVRFHGGDIAMLNFPTEIDKENLSKKKSKEKLQKEKFNNVIFVSDKKCWVGLIELEEDFVHVCSSISAVDAALQLNTECRRKGLEIPNPSIGFIHAATYLEKRQPHGPICTMEQKFLQAIVIPALHDINTRAKDFTDERRFVDKESITILHEEGVESKDKTELLLPHLVSLHFENNRRVIISIDVLREKANIDLNLIGDDQILKIPFPLEHPDAFSNLLNRDKIFRGLNIPEILNLCQILKWFRPNAKVWYTLSSYISRNCKALPKFKEEWEKQLLEF